MSELNLCSFRTLKEIYKHKEITKDGLAKKLRRKKDIDLDEAIRVLWRYDHIKYPPVGSDEFGGLIYDENAIIITHKGKIYIENCALEAKRHWQKIFVPQVLNIAVSFVTSAITTIATFFILRWLNTR